MALREMFGIDDPTKSIEPATYALARGVPALQTEPSRVRAVLLVCALLALLGGAVTGYVYGRQSAPPVSAPN